MRGSLDSDHPRAVAADAPAVQLSGVGKRYPNGFEALRDFDLEVGDGEFMVLGPSGCGKTTALRTVAGTGSPAMNLYEGTVSEGAKMLKLGGQGIDLGPDVVAHRPGLANYEGRSLVVGIRPEDEPRTPVRVGDRVGFTVDPIRLHFSDRESQRAILE